MKTKEKVWQKHEENAISITTLDTSSWINGVNLYIFGDILKFTAIFSLWLSLILQCF